MSTAAYIPAPALSQEADVSLILELGAIIFPGFVERNPVGNDLRLKYDGDYKDASLVQKAGDQFQVLLGILRAWRPIAGQRADEVRPGIGAGSIRDEHGNQIIMMGTAIAYSTVGSEIAKYARDAKAASERSPHLRKALWLNGQRGRSAAQFYMVYECAKADFENPKAIASALCGINNGITNAAIKRFKSSANNLTPTEGGRHARGSRTADWDLADQTRFIARFLRSWIAYRAHNP
jgi:hypothetical protein